MADLLDANVWLAFAVDGHPHHRAALEAWDKLSRPTFCRIAQLGWMRLLCNPQVMGNQALQPPSALARYESLLAGGSVHFLEEPATLQSHLKSIAKDATHRRDFWTDAYLAAFAKSAGMRMVTFDSGFSKFKDLNLLVLE